MQTALDSILKRFIVTGQLTVRWPDGRESLYSGDGGPSACMAIHTAAAVRNLIINPGLALGEAYMDGSVTAEGCGIYDILDVMYANMTDGDDGLPVLRFRTFLRRLKRRLDQYNPAGRAQKNVAHHYDLNGRLYSLFLDRDRQYSCGYFPRGDETLEEAQLAKKHHIAEKLLLDRPDLQVLDIGCGWGGMALTLAREYGARVTGITLSREQLAEARQ